MILSYRLENRQSEIPSLLIDLVKRFEGLRLKPYLCSAGVPTIGYGHTGKNITLLTKPITKEQAELLLASDLRSFYEGTKMLCPNANERQLCALTSFSYNVGLNAIKNSTLRKVFNKGDIKGAKIQLLRWNKAGGRVVKGLTLRRQAEASLL